MSADKRPGQEIQRFKHELLSVGCEEIRPDHPKFQKLWEGYVDTCTSLGTTPSRGQPSSRDVRTFWSLDIDVDSPEVLSPKELDLFPEYLFEGAETQTTKNVRERNKAAREICISTYSTEDNRIACLACKFDFVKVYGETGRGFIHVHHLDPIAEANGPRKVNPKIDLVPLCPNCHAMVHRRKPQLTISDLVAIMDSSQI